TKLVERDLGGEAVAAGVDRICAAGAAVLCCVDRDESHVGRECTASASRERGASLRLGYAEEALRDAIVTIGGVERGVDKIADARVISARLLRDDVDAVRVEVIVVTWKRFFAFIEEVAHHRVNVRLINA